VDYTYRDIVKEPPTAAELFELARLGGIKVTDLLNQKSKTYKDMGISAQNLSERDMAELLSANPKVIFRPLLTDGKRLVIGFNPEQIEEIL
jgi:Spx/MgsR family transcriptional regulator